MSALVRALKEKAHAGRSVGVIMVDIDHFKEINDTLGPWNSRAALPRVFARAINSDDTVARSF
jgi:diguanylate cyclase (GGDEF)-like protein